MDDKTATGDELMTGVEAAQYLGMTRSALYSIMRRGELARVETGTGHTREPLRFQREDVVRYKDAQLARRRATRGE